MGKDQHKDYMIPHEHQKQNILLILYNQKKNVLSLPYNGSFIMEVSYLLMPQNFINSKKKISEKKDYALCLRNVPKDFTINNMKKKTGLKAVVKSFLFDFNPIDTNDKSYWY